MALQLRPKCRSLPNPPTLIRFFSTSRDPTNYPPEDDVSPPSQSQSAMSSYLRDVKSKLKQHQQSRRPNTPFSASSHPPPSGAVSSEEISRNLAEFRRHPAAPSPPGSPSSKPVGVQELLKRNVILKGGGAERETGPTRPGSPLDFGAIRESLKHIRANTEPPRAGRGGGGGWDPLSLSSFKDSFKLKPGDGRPSPGSSLFGKTDKLPQGVFGKEMRERETGKEKPKKNDGAMRTDFVRVYGHEELGKKLRMLRPDGLVQGKGGFSLEELNERLGKLREMEEKETESRISGFVYKELRESLEHMKMADDEKAAKKIGIAMHGIDILRQMNHAQDFMLQPPQDHLVEQYFHPDNMSSEEKMKLELAKVREEFKMSESDCGSARVQVAQLTTKIKHLSSVLHKKDKHSRKGLQEMVQRRKKLLKYLRRTDWDSYCLVLSRFGLRDNPDFKH